MTVHLLNNGWAVRSSADVDADGDRLSRTGISQRGWYGADLPSTVIGAMVQSGAIEEPYHGSRILELPGQGPPAENFANHPMPADSPFAAPWWYRTEFRVPRDAAQHLALRLDGVNYRADVWLNGEQIATAEKIVGAYREFEIDLTERLSRRKLNALALKVHPPGEHDVALSWVDWNPWPPDKSTGLWRDVALLGSGPVALRAPHVITELDGAERARLVVGGDLVNLSDQAREVTVGCRVEGQGGGTEMSLGPGEQRRFEVELVIDEPRLWWPRVLGEPELYDAQIAVAADGAASDEASFRFGVREVSAELDDRESVLFRVNGEPVLVRGAGWACDMLLRRDPERDRAQLEYVKAMNLGAIRFEGMLERAEFLEWCDRDGIMVIAGWCCCDAWEKWDGWSEETAHVAVESLRSQIRRVRRHPSLISWWYGSDFPPPADIERRYLEVLEQERWPNPSQSSAAARPAELTGPSGLKMEGPYEYVPPGYWLEDDEHGGAFGFASEICPGPAVPPIESLCRMLPEEHLWPIDDVWHLHAGGKEFHNIDAFHEAIVARYGPVDGVEQFAELSQLLTYEGQRAMFEGYARNKFAATGVIQWMLNNAWPSLIWHLFDHYLRPGGGFFGTQKACAPLHVMYAPDDHSVVVVSDLPQDLAAMRVQARLFDAGLAELFSAIGKVDVQARGKARCLELPQIDVPLAFLDLRLTSAGGEQVDRNFYWLPREQDVLDHERADWMRTPVTRHADLSGLRELPEARINVDASSLNGGESVNVRAMLENPTDQLAFFVQLRLADEQGNDVLPVVWSDNYVSLLPGDEQLIEAQVPLYACCKTDLHLHVSGINVPSREVILPREKGKVA